MNKRSVGSHYEDVAAEYLIHKGYRILERNFSCRSGEIDIIAEDGEVLCFVEVKYRAGERFGDPLEAVTPHKIRQINNTARYYLMVKGYAQVPACRFDVVAIHGKNATAEDERAIELVKNAFGME